jgi:hypothetical protein
MCPDHSCALAWIVGRFWKKKFVELAGSREEAVKHRTAIYLVGASVAE